MEEIILKRKKIDIFKTIDNLLENLDKSKFTKNSIFSSLDDKIAFETKLLSAFQKYNAALYHKTNILRLIQEDTDKIITPTSKSSKQLPHGAKLTTNVSFTAEHYAFELTAFLAALRSSLDFLCWAAASFYPMYNGIRKSSKVIEMVEKKKMAGPLFDEVKNNISDLKYLIEYRDNIIHRCILCTIAGGESHTIGDITKSICYPVLIPVSPPVFIPDTRLIRSNIDAKKGLKTVRTEIYQDTSTHKKEIVDIDIKIDPIKGYISIEDFIQEQLSSFEIFFAQVIRRLNALDFKKQSK